MYISLMMLQKAKKVHKNIKHQTAWLVFFSKAWQKVSLSLSYAVSGLYTNSQLYHLRYSTIRWSMLALHGFFEGRTTEFRNSRRIVCEREKAWLNQVAKVKGRNIMKCGYDQHWWFGKGTAFTYDHFCYLC